MSTAPTNPGVGFIGIGHNVSRIRENGDKVKVAESLMTIANNANSLNRGIQNLQAIVSSFPTGLTLAEVLAYLVGLGFARSLQFTLSPLASGANIVNPAVPLYEGDRLSIRVQQNGSGNGTVTFGANVKWCDANYVTITPNLWTIWDTIGAPDPTDSNNLKWFGVAPANAEQTL